MRVLHVIDSLEQQAGSYACLWHDLWAELHTCGVASSLVTRSGGEAAAGLPGPDVDLTVVEPKRGWGGGSSLRGLMSRLIREAEVVHLHGPVNGLNRAAARAARRTGRPYVLSPHLTLAPNPFERRSLRCRLSDRFYANRLLGGATCLHAGSQVEVDLVRRRGVEVRAEIIPPSVSPKRYQGACDTDGLLREVPPLADHRCLLFLGYIHPIEGLAPLLWACEGLVDKLEEWHLILAGPAPRPWREQIKAAIRRRGEHQRVTMLVGPGVEQQMALLARAELLVQPTLRPQVPTAVLQAMAGGVPVIASDRCGLEQIETRRAGLVAAPEKQALREALERMLTASEEQRREMGRNGRSLVDDEFDCKLRAPHFARLYDSVRGSA